MAFRGDSQSRFDSDLPSVLTPTEAGRPAQQQEMSQFEAQVLGCLAEALSGLTQGQVVARLSSTPEAVAPALKALVNNGFAARLNTIVPSYCARHRDVDLTAK